jgi:hypothetical protein
MFRVAQGLLSNAVASWSSRQDAKKSNYWQSQPLPGFVPLPDPILVLIGHGHGQGNEAAILVLSASPAAAMFGPRWNDSRERAPSAWRGLAHGTIGPGFWFCLL